MSGNFTLTLGNVTVERIIDLDPFAIPLGVLFPGATLDELRPLAESLGDRHLDVSAGKILLAIQSYLLRIAGKTILIDACVGEQKPRPLRPEWNNRTATRYLDNLAAAGCAPQQIDIVMCTHLHADHVGWNTRLESGAWVPTFPNARYVMSQREIDQRAREAAQSPQANHGSYQDSVLPILDHGLATVAQSGDHLGDGTTIVALPGHTPGQIGLEVARSDGSRLLFCGDAIHSPVQVLRPEWSSAFCFDKSQSAETRHMILQRCAREDLLLLPAHLRGAGMRIRETAGSFYPVIGD